MSQQELDRTDQEVMDLVNGAAAPEANANAESLRDALQRREEKEAPAPIDQQIRQNQEQFRQRVKKRQRRKLVVSLVLCLVVAGLLLAAMFAPELVVWVTNLGVLSCGIVAAIVIDRFLWWKRCE